MTEPNPPKPETGSSPLEEEPFEEEPFEEIIERVLDNRLRRRLKRAGDIATATTIIAGFIAALSLGARFAYTAGQRDVRNSAEYMHAEQLRGLPLDQTYCVTTVATSGWLATWPAAGTSKSCQKEVTYCPEGAICDISGANLLSRSGR